MTRTSIDIRTNDGVCPASVFRPNGVGSWPAVIVYMDGPGIRPVLFEMGERLASHGYLVLLPDLFYRAGPYAPVDPKELFGDPQKRAAHGRFFTSTSNGKAAADTRAFLDYLDSRDDVRGSKIGVTGYCMGGGIALRAAGTFPDRVAASASFHGGNMATDTDNSPHRLAPQIRAKVLVAGADEDGSFDPAQCGRLDQALKEAGVDAEVSIWKGLKHGWVPADMPVHDAAGAERHWKALIALFDETLKVAA